MRSTVLPIATLLYGASVISAQSISSGCQNSLAQVFQSPDAACLNPSGLFPLAAGGDNTSIVAPLNNWLSGFCSAAPCSNQTLANIVTNIASGCSDELKALGLGSTTTAELTAAVQQIYPTIRKVVCLKDDATNQLCVTETLTNIEKTTGPLTLSKIGAALSNPTVYFNQIPKEVLCSNCEKAAYNILSQDLVGILPSSYKSAVSSNCGESFVDGQNPSGISQSATLAAAIAKPSTGKNSAMTYMPVSSGGGFVGLVMSLFVAVSSAFAFLA